MKNELEKVRNWAEARLRAGVPGRSWPRYVRLIESIDAMLHDISVAESASCCAQGNGVVLRVVEQDNRQDEQILISPSWRRRRVRARH